ncbi:MAG TPA: hypothetical protein VK464_20915 [Symbiobacteriaceae bacterium]|nr:hypothetical protein [Symbiobacteriaceae bacterium]
MPRDLGTQQVRVTDGSVLIHQAPRRSESKRVRPPAEAPQNQAAPEELQAVQAALPEAHIAPEVDQAPELDEELALQSDGASAEVAGEVSGESAAFTGEEFGHRTAGLTMEIGAPEPGALERVYGDGSQDDQSEGDDSYRGASGAQTLVLDSFVVPGGARTVTRSRNHVPAPPLGWGIEFGTGRLVPIHSFKGRMSYGDHS